MREDAGRGWRRVVASPLPKKIVEAETIKRLWDSTILITCGGGGIPCILNEQDMLQFFVNDISRRKENSVTISFKEF